MVDRVADHPRSGPPSRPVPPSARLAMKFSELTVLLPCHSLEDFPVYHEGAAADELLGAWCAPWHPALIAEVGSLPNWQRIDIPPEDLSGRLIVVPPFCLDRLPAGYAARAGNEGAWFVAREKPDEAEAQALAGLDNLPAIEPEIAADFRALGFCRLQMELLTRQMRYSVSIDETHFQNQAVSAARAAVAGDVPAAREHLQQCFDTLYERASTSIRLTCICSMSLCWPTRHWALHSWGNCLGIRL